MAVKLKIQRVKIYASIENKVDHEIRSRGGRG